MSTKHTPEPLDIQNKGNLYGPSARLEVVQGENIDGKEDLPTIATMPDLSDQSYANARLFASAPTLLKVLKIIDEEWDIIHDHHLKSRLAAKVRITQWRRKVQAAIAKAEPPA